MNGTDEYEAAICRELAGARRVPLRIASLSGWSAEQTKCHENVDRWTAATPGHTAVRGWAVYVVSGNAIQLTAHSVVRDPDGSLYDITPLSDERARPSMRFVPHIGDERTFFEKKKLSIYIYCPDCDREPV